MSGGDRPPGKQQPGEQQPGDRPSDQGRPTNRLADEVSPYLRQHAHNPVDWYPWGREALARAQALDRPIFLSIGYSACHWCHVMERESFDDPAIAEALDAGFVAIKVDREERPDLDGIYMRAVQALTGRGGWPLSAFLTPDGVPFHGGTYYPPEPRHGMPSFRQVLAAVADAWTHRRADVLAGAEEMRAALARAEQPLGGTPREARDDLETPAPGEVRIDTPPAPGMLLARDAAAVLRRQFDPVHGGFGGAPKFPQPVTLEFLLAHYAATGSSETLESVVHTLRHMAEGGMRDHLGGGFHRYSVDARWMVPHFEKMTYDNALLARVYTDAWKATGLDALRRVAEATLDDLLRDFRDPEGGFYSARDADSEGEEGRFYLWTPDEIDDVARDEGLPEGDAALFRRVYDVQPGGNFEQRSILHLPHPFEAAARREGLTPDELREHLTPIATALLRARAERPAPFRDEKVLCVWNAFTVRALAEAAVAFDRDDYLDAAVTTGRFLQRELRVDGRLRRVWMQGEARIDAFLDDHAALGNAFLTLHETTLDAAWFDAARAVTGEMVDRFYDADRQLFHDAPSDAEPLIVRPREILDTATPSGNSLAVELLLRMGHLTDAPHWTGIAERVLAREAEAGRRFPAALGRLLTQVVRATTPPVEIALMGKVDDPRMRGLVAAAWKGLHPNRSVVGGGADTPLLEGRGPRAPLEESDRIEAEGAASAEAAPPTAWVCRAFVCNAPVHDPGDVIDAVAAVSIEA